MNDLNAMIVNTGGGEARLGESLTPKRPIAAGARLQESLNLGKGKLQDNSETFGLSTLSH